MRRTFSRKSLRNTLSVLSPFRVLSRWPRSLRSAVVAALFLLLATLDLLTSPDVSFLVFYSLPVLLAAWYLGPLEGLLVSVGSIAVLVADDLIARKLYSHPTVPLWNHGGELAFFVFFSWLVGALHAAFEREVTAREERLVHDLSLASEVQSALLPPQIQEGPRFSVAAECRQAFGVGGDAWDVTAIGDDVVSVAIADVSGKGMPAALLMAGFLGALRSLRPASAGCLGQLAADLSEKLRLATPETRFVTAFIGVVEDGVLRYVNAGHEPGLLLPPPGGLVAPRPLRSSGPALGLLPHARFQEERVPFPPGGSLILYTDGLTECEDPEGAELGRERVGLLAASLAGASPATVVRELLAAADAHAAGAPLPDDVTILCLARRSAAAPGAT